MLHEDPGLKISSVYVAWLIGAMGICTGIEDFGRTVDVNGPKLNFPKVTVLIINAPHGTHVAQGYAARSYLSYHYVHSTFNNGIKSSCLAILGGVGIVLLIASMRSA
ncbi:hypothetical protein AXF42_Ash015314 [Apostasia shenzhenica]|uniref:Uncharacterized protein n=1 Tax=Apostasia shenzhenica TaxID=1088818 RepID=A0A2I0ALU9_9ASPA|nr:hypothetical protein AXF42_Ash015314 [Apostasia shenzhenica]